MRINSYDTRFDLASHSHGRRMVHCTHVYATLHTNIMRTQQQTKVHFIAGVANYVTLEQTNHNTESESLRHCQLSIEIVGSVRPVPVL